MSKLKRNYKLSDMLFMELHIANQCPNKEPELILEPDAG